MTGRGKPPIDPRTTLREAAHTLPEMQALRAGSSRPPVDEHRRAVLVVLAGPQLGERTLIDRSVAIGRAPDNDLVLRDPAASWKHAVVETARLASGAVGIRVRDLGSKHGTEVNGTRIHADTFLERGDQLGIGDTLLRLEMHDAVEVAFDRAVIERIARDDLTGLLSRRRFETDLAALAEAANLVGDTLAVAMLDIDGIKAINDVHGHLAGAQSIAAVGRLVGRVIGGRGLSARLGGDELAIALPRVTAHDARQTLEQVLREVRALDIPFGEVSLRVTISAGIAMLPADATDEPTLMRVADERLLAAKQAGRDRIG